LFILTSIIPTILFYRCHCFIKIHLRVGED